jgi:hypothetical protein
MRNSNSVFSTIVIYKIHLVVDYNPEVVLNTASNQRRHSTLTFILGPARHSPR